MINVKIEPFSVVKENFYLVQEHWDEVVKHDGTQRELNVDWEMLDLFEQANRLITVIARENEKVVGYATFIIQKHFHAKDSLCAHTDAIFLKKEHRKGRAGILLIKESHRILGELYPNVIVMWHVTALRDFGGLLLKLGYKKFETIYAIRAGV